MAPRVRQPHTVPAFYLRGFATTGRKGKRKLHVLDLERGKWREESPERASRQRDFYSVDLPEIDPDSIERDFIGRIEDAAAPLIRKIRDRHLPLSGEELGHIVAFAALMHVRSTVSRAAVQGRADQAFRYIMAKAARDPETWEENRRRAEKDGLDMSALSFETIWEIIEGDDVRFDIDRNWHILVLVGGWRDVFDTFVERDWSLLSAPANAGLLVTSDDPVSVYSKEASDAPPGVFPTQMTERSVGIMLPLDPHTMLVGDHDFGPEFRRIDAVGVARCNTATILPGRRVVYTKGKSFRWLDPETNEIRGPDELQPYAQELSGRMELLNRQQAASRLPGIFSDQDPPWPRRRD